VWLATVEGFYSVVQDIESGKLLVRARVRNDLKRLPGLKAKIIYTPLADYPYRVVLGRKVFEKMVVTMLTRINYPNFKDRIKEKQGANRAGIYTRVWWDLQDLEVRSPVERWFTKKKQQPSWMVE